MTKLKLIELIQNEDTMSAFIKSLGSLDFSHSNQILASLNNKKYKVTLTSDIKNFEI